MVSSLRQTGDFRLAESYKHLKIDPNTWVNLPEESRKAKIKYLMRCLPERTNIEKNNITQKILNNEKIRIDNLKSKNKKSKPLFKQSLNADSEKI